MVSKFLNISTDTTLGGSGADDGTVASQKAIKGYVDAIIGEISATVDMDRYLDLIIAGNSQYLPSVLPNNYTADLSDIIGGTYVNQ